MESSAHSYRLRKRSGRSRMLLIAIVVLGVVAGAGVYLRPLSVWYQVNRMVLRAGGVKGDYVQLSPYRIHYLRAGEGRPLILVHGIASRAEDWGLLIPALARHGFRVYAIDLLGFGGSDRPNVDYSMALQADILRQFLASQRLERPDIGGWSMGGWISLKFALDHPESLRRVFVYDSAGVTFPLMFGPSVLHPATREQVAELMRLLAPLPVRVPGFVLRDILRHMRQQNWVLERAVNSMLGGKDLLDGKLQGVTAPIALLWGKQDALIPLLCAVEMHREMPQSILRIFDGCGHLAPVLCRDRTLPEILRFLEADPPLPAGVQEFP